MGQIASEVNAKLNIPIDDGLITPFKIKVDIEDLRIRTGAGTNYKATGKYTGKGVFTIVEVKKGPGSDTGWGKLKSDVGWISLDYTTRV